MIEPLKIASSHEELFTNRYQRLLAWSMQLTGNERDLAEDLLHDAYVQFTFAKPDLASIKNLDGYFYSMLRNLHLSHVRRETRNRWQQLSVVEYDSAEDGLRTTDLRDQLHVQDELRKVCHYVCVRKETARAASVLILRFFHGYYPSEIVQFLRTTREAVDVQLLIARREARLSFENPQALTFMDAKQLPELFPAAMARGTDEFLQELCLTIYQSKRGTCLSRKQLRELYSTANQNPIQVAQLAHLVSCPSCLDEVNRMLGLPLLSERNPTETLGRDNRPKRPGGGGPKGGGGTGIGSWRRRARRVFEHKPQALAVAVNGYMQASQPVSSELSELNLNIDLLEDISFVEVFSEQKLRLLLLNIDDVPPAGPGEREQLIEMSDGRTLSLKLEFRSPWPALHVAYHDPTFKEVQELLNDSSSEEVLPVVLQTPVEEEIGDAGRFFDYRNVINGLRGIFGTSFWLRPSTITAIVALVLTASLLLTRLHVGPAAPGPAELLRQATDAEKALAARTDTVLHRGITVEEYNASNGVLIARRRIEIWHSAEKGITARRVFDDQNNLVAGGWRRADGVQTIYHHGIKPQLQLTNPQSSVRNFEDVWQTDLAARDFIALIGNAERAHVQETTSIYIISYGTAGASQLIGGETSTEPRTGRNVIAQRVSPGSEVRNDSQPRRGEISVAPSGAQDETGRTGSQGSRPGLSPDVASRLYSANNYATLLKATLTLSKADLHAIEQTLTLKQGNDVREFRMMETSFERRPPSTVAPAVFEPEPELLSGTKLETPNSKLETDSPFALSHLPRAASAELEVEVLSLINQSGADLGDEVNVRRTPEGQLLVQGIVETDQRKNEVLRTLAPVAGNPAVKLKVETVAEALRRQSDRQGRSGDQTVERLESGGSRISADAELRRYFAAKGLSGAQLDQSVNQYAARMMDRSLQALRHSGAMDRLAQRFSLEQLRTLDPEARTKWLGLLRSHARALERELSSLRRDLGPFIASGSSSQEGFKIDSDAELQQGIHRLFALCSATDQAVRSAFTISESSSGASAIKSPQFFRSLTAAEDLARRVEAAARP